MTTGRDVFLIRFLKMFKEVAEWTASGRLFSPIHTADADATQLSS